MEKTLVILKPDAVQRQLVGRIISRLETKGLKIVAMKMLSISPQLAEGMYAEHKGKEFYPHLIKYMTSSPVVAAALEGADAVAVVRSLAGPTFGPEAPAGTIRGDFGMSRRHNLLHASDSLASAEREIDLFFRPEELIKYELASSTWLYSYQDGKVV